MSQTIEPNSQRAILRWRKNNHLPNDIVFNILASLPVKSVIRFRCLCKSWDSSITGPNFISTHLKLNNHNHGARLLFLSSTRSSIDTQVICTVTCERTFDMISKIQLPLCLPPTRIVGSINGLLCLSKQYYPYCPNSNPVYLWNPSIRKFKMISSTSSILNTTLFHSSATGLGYHSQTNDYKVVRIFCWRLNQIAVSPPQAEIYSLSLGSWRRLPGMFRPGVILHNIFDSSLPAPFVSGALHWLAYVSKSEKEPWQQRCILTFDVNKDKFGLIPLPYAHCHRTTGFSYETPTLFKGKLALIGWERTSLLNVWVMKEYDVSQSWTKLFVVPINTNVGLLGYSENGLILDRKNFYFDSAKGKIKHVLIDVETLHENDIGIQYISYMSNIMESLVLLDRADTFLQ